MKEIRTFEPKAENSGDVAMRFSLIAALCFAGMVYANPSSWVYYNSAGKLFYQTLSDGSRIMDFSHAGYMGGGVAIPDVPTVQRLSPSGGDDRAALQNAINAVATNSLIDGFRGALQLSAGTFLVSGSINMNASGVVVRGAGSGAGGTVLKMTAASPMTLFNITGAGSAVTGSAVNITNTYIPSGATFFDVSSTNGLSVGDDVLIYRPVTAEWISYMGMDQLVRDGVTQTWMNVGSTITTDRKITGIAGSRVTIDSPLTDSFDAQYLGTPVGTLKRYTWANRISQVGLEHLRIEAPLVESAYISINLNNISDSWIRDLVIQDGVNCFAIGKNAKRITVDEVTIQHTVPSTAAGPPGDFSCTGTQILFNKCRSLGTGSWAFVTQSAGTGPIVLLNFYSTQILGISPHQRWTTGLLADHCDLPNSMTTAQGISYRNRRTMGSGQGWTTGWSVAWNVTTPGFLVSAAPGTTNWCIGGIGTRTSLSEPDGVYESLGNYVSLGTTGSLYLEQLRERLGNQALANIGYGASVTGTTSFVLLSDDLSTLNHFTNTTISGSSWVSNGTDAVHTNGTLAAHRARLTSTASVDLNPGGIAYQSVTLKFTTRSGSGTSGRFEVGLVDVASVSKYSNPLAYVTNVYGAVVCQTSNYNPPGLLFNKATGIAPGTNAVDVSMTALTNVHNYKIVFTAAGTELFQDEVSQGTTPNALDFTREYKIVAFGQGSDSVTKSLCAVQLEASQSRLLLLDDLSTRDNFTNDYKSASHVYWRADGTNAVYTGGAGTGDRSRLVSLDSFDLNPGGIGYQSVALEFTTRSGSETSGRFEVGLVDATTFSSYNNPLAYKTDVYGAVVCQTSNYNPPGLLFNKATGTAPGTTAVDIPMTARTHVHTYKIVFTAAGAELFQDGVSQGTTPYVLDLTRDYKIVAFAQGLSSSVKELRTVRLTAEAQALLTEECSTLGNFQNATHLDAFWSSDGTHFIYNNNGSYSANRASLYSKGEFDFNPGGIPCEFVLLEFTSSISDVSSDGANRLELGFISRGTVAAYSGPLSAQGAVEGAVIAHTDDANPAGLIFNRATGTAPGSEAVHIAMTKSPGTHTYTVFFSTAGTSLFRDGVFQGSTTNALDFTKDYKLVAFGQDDTSEKSLGRLFLGTLLPGWPPEGSREGWDEPIPPLRIGSILLDGGFLLINVGNAHSGTTYTLLSSTNMTLPLAQWSPVASHTPTAENFCITNYMNSNDVHRFYLIKAQEAHNDQ